MIRINLLPDDLKKRSGSRRKSGGGGFLVFLMILFMLGTTGSAGYFLFAVPYMSTDSKLKNSKKELASIEKKVKQKREEIGNLAEIEKIARNQLEVLTILDPPDRLLWSEKLNLMSDLRPHNVYLKKVTLTEQVIEIETAASKKNRERWEKARAKGKAKGKKPNKITRPQITQYLKLIGLARPSDPKANNADEQAIQSFLDFQTALQTHKVKAPEGDAIVTARPFMDGLERITIGDWEKVQVAGQWVIEFNLSIKSKPLFKQENKPNNNNKKVASAKK